MFVYFLLSINEVEPSTSNKCALSLFIQAVNNDCHFIDC